MSTRNPRIVGEQGLDLSTIKDRDGVAPVFTVEQEARLRQIVREEIDADRLIGSGCDNSGAYARGIAFDRAHIRSPENVDAARAELRAASRGASADRAQPYE